MRNDVILTLGYPFTNVSMTGQQMGYAVGTPTIVASSGGGGGGSGGPNMPSGMTVVINTGPMTTPPSQVQSGTWLENGYTFTNFSPNTISSTGELASNIALDPSGVGLQMTYAPTLSPGFSPVRYAPQGFSVSGTGWFYSLRSVKFSTNWTSAPVATGVKMGEPHTTVHGSGALATENHVQMGTYNITGNGTLLQPMVVLQGPNNQSRNLTPTSGASVGLITGGLSHTIEELFTPESIPGAGDGQYQCWTDGTLTNTYNNVNWIASGQTPGWPDYLVDPVYGGLGSSPPVTMTWTLISLFIAVK